MESIGCSIFYPHPPKDGRNLNPQLLAPFDNIGMLCMQELFFLGEGTLKPLFAQLRPPPLHFQKVLQEMIYSSIC